ncbi:presqualene diphosphate synthase HpnD [Rhizosaccharibacter radicis]|uniref:Presqualene diphosphate synthase HpnD n=1 Tax=Rhizosaccharibacter radicis TaxID=2782605 RepID=A0ABT1W0D5_9PROT|nr:presqualene diphosphate synthase HpnD [Acetobacteraceae bacterium KSS12]
MGPEVAGPDARGALGCALADLSAVERIVRRSGTSFARGMAVLPADRRFAMFAIYGFCRLVDDVADEEAPFSTKLPRLLAWRERVARLFGDDTLPAEGSGGAVADPAASDSENAALDRVLRAAIRRFALREEDFAAVIDGMRMDAEEVIVAPPFRVFDLYCDRAASAVGRLSVRAFGDRSAAADEVAFHLGRALQITNILRDLGEDAERGRLYLPREVLGSFGVPLDPEGALRSPRLPEACRAMAARARFHFNKADAAMRRCDRAAMRPARLMGASYRAILRTLERDGWRTPEARLSVPGWRKLPIALRALSPWG